MPTNRKRAAARLERCTRPENGQPLFRDFAAAIRPADLRAMLHDSLPRIDTKVMLENDLGVLVRLHKSLPSGKIGAPGQLQAGDDDRRRRWDRTAASRKCKYRPPSCAQWKGRILRSLPTNNTTWASTSNTSALLSGPGLPFSLVFRAEPGHEDMLLKVAAAYEGASKRRVAPPASGPLAGEPRSPAAAAPTAR